jgi:cytochrome c556
MLYFFGSQIAEIKSASTVWQDNETLKALNQKLSADIQVQ